MRFEVACRAKYAKSVVKDCRFGR